MMLQGPGPDLALESFPSQQTRALLFHSASRDLLVALWDVVVDSPSWRSTQTSVVCVCMCELVCAHRCIRHHEYELGKYLKIIQGVGSFTPTDA
jgi:hypothetical protein